jgi:hypothetical protein
MRRALIVLLTVNLFGLAVAVLTGLTHLTEAGQISIHAVAGFLLFLTALAASLLWLGIAVTQFRRRPVRISFGVLYCVLFCFACWSNNVSGYLGPSSIDPGFDRANALRFVVIHQWVMPILAGVLAGIWLLRLHRHPIA